MKDLLSDDIMAESNIISRRGRETKKEKKEKKVLATASFDLATSGFQIYRYMSPARFRCAMLLGLVSRCGGAGL